MQNCKFNHMHICFLKFPFLFAYRGNQQQQAHSNLQEIPTQSWYPSSVVSSSSRPTTPASSSGVDTHHAQPSPAEAAGVIACLKEKRYFFFLQVAQLLLKYLLWLINTQKLSGCMDILHIWMSLFCVSFRPAVLCHLFCWWDSINSLYTDGSSHDSSGIQCEIIMV